MNSPIPIKMLSHRLVLISAAILLHANNVLAAESVGDAQMQARDLLSGTVGGRAKTVDASPAIPADGHQTSNLDPQEQACAPVHLAPAAELRWCSRSKRRPSLEDKGYASGVCARQALRKLLCSGISAADDPGYRGLTRRHHVNGGTACLGI